MQWVLPSTDVTKRLIGLDLAVDPVRKEAIDKARDTGATVVAHAAARDYLYSDTARLRLQASREELFPWVDENTRVMPADVWVRGQQDLPLHIGSTRFVLHHVGPSHTDEDLAVHMPERGVLFVGDLVFRGRIPFVGNADSRAWIAAIDRVSAGGPASVTRRPEAGSPR